MKLITYDWQDKKAKKSKKSKKGESGGGKSNAKSVEASPSTNGTGAAATNGQVSKRHAHAAPRVEEVEDE